MVIKFIEGFIKKDFVYFILFIFFLFKNNKNKHLVDFFLGYLKGLSKWDIKVMKERDDGNIYKILSSLRRLRKFDGFLLLICIILFYIFWFCFVMWMILGKFLG